MLFHEVEPPKENDGINLKKLKIKKYINIENTTDFSTKWFEY